MIQPPELGLRADLLDDDVDVSDEVIDRWHAVSAIGSLLKVPPAGQSLEGRHASLVALLRVDRLGHGLGAIDPAEAVQERSVCPAITIVV